MKNKINHYLLVIAVIVIVLTIYTLHKPAVPLLEPGEQAGVPLEHVKRLFPAAEKLVHPKNNRDWIAILDGSGKHIGSTAHSSPHADDIAGYGGSTPLLIGIDTDGKIIGVILLENTETESFVEKVIRSDFLKKWNGIHWKEAGNIDVQTVSGATMTSTSVKETLHKRTALIDPNTSVKAPQTGAKSDWKDIGIILVPLLGLVMCFSKWKQNTTLRYVLMALSIVWLGFLTASCFSMALVSAWAVNGIKSSVSWGILVLCGLAVIVPIFTGRNFYCFFICPFGSLQELLNKIIPWKLKIPPKWNKNLRYVRYVMLVIITVSLLLGIKMDPNNLEPFSAFRFKMAGTAAITIAVISLILSCGTSRPWCSFGCSAGALLDLLKKPADNETKSKNDRFDNC